MASQEVPLESASPPTKPDVSDIDDDKAAASQQRSRQLGPDVVRDAHGDVPPLSASWRHQPLSDDEKMKAKRILEACRDCDYSELNKLAGSPGGFIEDELRRAACEWPSGATIAVLEQLP